MARPAQAQRPEALARREIAPASPTRGPSSQPGPVSESRDGVVIGIITLILGLALLVVPTQYALQYTIEEARQTFTLTGITIGVGIFGAYAAIVAVYLAIAGFSPRKRRSRPRRRAVPSEQPRANAPADQKDPA